MKYDDLREWWDCPTVPRELPTPAWRVHLPVSQHQVPVPALLNMHPPSADARTPNTAFNLLERALRYYWFSSDLADPSFSPGLCRAVFTELIHRGSNNQPVTEFLWKTACDDHNQTTRLCQALGHWPELPALPPQLKVPHQWNNTHSWELRNRVAGHSTHTWFDAALLGGTLQQVKNWPEHLLLKREALSTALWHSTQACRQLVEDYPKILQLLLEQSAAAPARLLLYFFEHHPEYLVLPTTIPALEEEGPNGLTDPENQRLTGHCIRHNRWHEITRLDLLPALAEAIPAEMARYYPADLKKVANRDGGIPALSAVWDSLNSLPRETLWRKRLLDYQELRLKNPINRKTFVENRLRQEPAIETAKHNQSKHNLLSPLFGVHLTNTETAGEEWLIEGLPLQPMYLDQKAYKKQNPQGRIQQKQEKGSDGARRLLNWLRLYHLARQI